MTVSDQELLTVQHVNAAQEKRLQSITYFITADTGSRRKKCCISYFNYITRRTQC